MWWVKWFNLIGEPWWGPHDYTSGPRPRGHFFYFHGLEGVTTSPSLMRAQHVLSSEFAPRYKDYKYPPAHLKRGRWDQRNLAIPKALNAQNSLLERHHFSRKISDLLPFIVAVLSLPRDPMLTWSSEKQSLDPHPKWPFFQDWCSLEGL